MIVRVKIEGRTYNVEIGSLSEKPIIALIDGEKFEVWHESSELHSQTPSKHIRSSEAQATSQKTVSTETKATEQNIPRAPASSPETRGDMLLLVKAPIPGIITAILVQPGTEVQVGQELCKLEAMKMNNSIRASRTGKVGSVNVSIGQHVKHNDVLIEFVS